MADGWSQDEVEAAVADYLAMLRAERSGVPYNKSEHRRKLAPLLDGRTDGSIERKHQNISAALIELGMPYIEGYKPLANFQRILIGAVADQVDRSVDLHAILRQEATSQVELPTVEDILKSLVDPPTRSKIEVNPYKQVRETPNLRRNVDYSALEAANRSLGFTGEQYVVRFEQARLLADRQDRLAAAVDHVSESRGDGLGYDILSFESDGRERLIEVKTTAYGPSMPFFVTRNEVATAQSAPDRYHLCRLFDFRRNPRLFFKQGQIERGFTLDPIQFLARLRDI